MCFPDTVGSPNCRTNLSMSTATFSGSGSRPSHPFGTSGSVASEISSSVRPPATPSAALWSRCNTASGFSPRAAHFSAAHPGITSRHRFGFGAAHCFSRDSPSRSAVRATTSPRGQSNTTTPNAVALTPGRGASASFAARAPSAALADRRQQRQPQQFRRLADRLQRLDRRLDDRRAGQRLGRQHPRPDRRNHPARQTPGAVPGAWSDIRRPGPAPGSR